KYINHVEEYEQLKKIEDQILMVKTVETFKNHLKTSRIGEVVLDDNNIPEEEAGNTENAKLFDNFMRALLYGQKYVLSDTDSPLYLGKALNFMKKSVNSLAGREIWKENENPTPLSMVKTMEGINRWFQLKTLGLEWVTG